MNQVSYEERVIRGAALPESGGLDFDLHYSEEYLQTIGWISLKSGEYPRQGGLEDQDPIFLRDKGTMILLRERILNELQEEGVLAQWDKIGERLRKK